MSFRRRLSDQLIESFQNACDAHNATLAAVLREAANIERAGVQRPNFVDRRPNRPAFRRALTHHEEVFHA